MEVMNLVLLTQYFDSLKSIASAPNTSSIFIPHTPNSMSDFSDQMRNAIMQAGQITDHKEIDQSDQITDNEEI